MKENFPYTIRIVSEITESNGSSSMATVCGSSLSLMATGVPIKSSVAGIAMGLIKEGANFVVLSDIMGDEDHLGDMDFKVAGTSQGITALQMDIKINGINEEIMRTALNQAKDGRNHILGKMDAVISQAKPDISENAPRITTIKIDKDKIREVIGSGGKVIREICEKSGAKIDIADDGTINIASVNEEGTKIALSIIQGITTNPQIGDIFDGKVSKIMDFGAIINFLGTREGLLHISELTPIRGSDASEFLSVGQEVAVKVVSVDSRSGKVKLGLKDKPFTSEENNDEQNDIVEHNSENKTRSSFRGDYNDQKGGYRHSQGNRRDDRSDRGDRPSRGDRPDRGDRPSRGDRPDRSDRPARGDRSERGGNFYSKRRNESRSEHDNNDGGDTKKKRRFF
jgi:polyribonucleotide nucleotidyltransferase